MLLHKILIAEDKNFLALNCYKSLHKLGYKVSDITFSGEEAVKKIGENHLGLVLIDIWLTGKNKVIRVADIISKFFYVFGLYSLDNWNI